jgi:hypothetical protein
MGEMYAKIIKHVSIDGLSWKPLMPLNITRTGALIIISYNIPYGNLSFDTQLVAQRLNMGFDFLQTNGNSVSISNVSLSNDKKKIQITLSNTPTGSNQRIRYAWGSNQTCGYHCGDAQNPLFVGGNVRDTDTRISPAIGGTGLPLYNWSVAFDEPVN